MSISMATGAHEPQAVNAPLRGRALIERIPELLDFRAPYLERKLQRLGVASCTSAARSLFQEVKKYLLLSELHLDRRIGMFSTRIDEAWHQFALFTRQYEEFCLHFFGRFVHHAPAESPDMGAGSPAPEMTREEFAAVYAEHFGPLSAAWFDERQVTGGTRLVRAPWTEPMQVAEEADRAVLRCAGEPPRVLCRVPLRAAGALRFIAEHRFFLVRELPGLGQRQRLDLCEPLVGSGILKVAP